MDLEDDYQHSDEDIDDATHAKLIKNVLNLHSKQYVKKSSRTEPTLNISEYDLVKSGKTVHLSDLTKALKSRGGKHVAIEKKVRKAEKTGKTLPKPLEKPQADRIRRTVAYQNAKVELDKWEPIVTSLRAAAQIKYPLQSNVNLKDDGADSKWRLKSDLEKELEDIQPKVEVITVETEEKFPMSMREIMERRKEAAKLRAYQSYKEAKARRQNKIKSKKYHRIQKREKVKQQMKDFELLQKTDPQAALEKLEEIEKARAEERISLRHKGTGKWAKNKQIRAKYDKDSRQVLAQQLAISRDLTQKQKINDSDSEREELELENAVRNSNNSDNPWTNNPNIKVAKEVGDFLSGYRKYWEEKNGIKTEESNNDEAEVSEINQTIELNASIPENKTELKGKKRLSNSNDDKQEKVKVSKKKVKVNDKKLDLTDSSRKISKLNKEKVKASNKKSKKPEVVQGTSEWEIVDIDKELTKKDTKLQKSLQDRYNKIKKEFLMEGKPLNSTNKKGKKLKKKIPDLSIPVKATRPVIDEQLGETTEDKPDSHPVNDIEKMKAMLSKDDPKKDVEDIDPNKFMRVKKAVELNTEIPDLVGFDDNEEDADQKNVIIEAFQDDDIADDFQKEKKDDINKNKVANVDLVLPGWGSWGGKDIKVPSRKRRRFMMKFPKKMPRKDKNKGNLIIKEGTSAKLKPHLVSEVPFPFKDVRDYEASIRAPIGNTFVPETAYRKMIQPAVITKLGTIIEPMTHGILLKKKK